MDALFGVVLCKGRCVMDDIGCQSRVVSARSTVLAGLICASLLLVLNFTGCSLFVMAGKAIFGDPQRTCAFTRHSQIRLVDEKKPVLIVCTFSNLSQNEHASVEAEVVEHVSRRLKQQGIPVIKSGKFYHWLEEHGSVWETPEELAAAFDVNYIIHIRIDDFSHQVKSGQEMLQGRTVGRILTHHVVERGKPTQRINQIFNTEFRMTYPKNNPIVRGMRSENAFLQEYILHMSHEVARYFYDHRASEIIE